MKLNVEDNFPESDQEENALSGKFLLLLGLGFALVLIGVIIILAAVIFLGKASTSANVVIFIGPFPIIFGSGVDTGLIIVLSIIIAVVSIMLFFIMNKKLQWVRA